MVNLGILEKIAYPEVPARVKYKLTPIGERFTTILDALAELQGDIDAFGNTTHPPRREFGEGA